MSDPTFFARSALLAVPLYLLLVVVLRGTSALLKHAIAVVAALALAVALVLVLPPGSLSYFTTFLLMGSVYAVLTLGLNVQWGYTGLFNIGIAAFFAIGAFTSALVTTVEPTGSMAAFTQQLFGLGAPFWVGLLAAGLASGLLALIVGGPTLRLRGDYLAIATIGIGELVRLVFQNERWLANGPQPLRGLPQPLSCLASSEGCSYLPGFVNAFFAHSVLVGFASCGPLFGKGRTVEVVGTPLRPSLVNRPTREESLARFGLDPAKKTVMVMGGSQGARRVNELVAASLPQLAAAGLQVLHISGPGDYELVKPAYDALPSAGVLRDFCSEIQYAYAAADLAVCRSGASTLTELGYYEIPSVLIPYPFAAEDHQTSNARIFSDPGAAELWPQAELNEQNFSGKIIELITDKERLEKMKESATRLSVPDASLRVCEVIAASLA